MYGMGGERELQAHTVEIRPISRPPSRQQSPQSTSVWPKVFASGVGSCLSAIVVCPFDVVKARLQAQTHNSSLQFTGMVDAFAKISKHEGSLTLWRGLPPTLMMSVPAGALYFTSYEYLKSYFKLHTDWGYMLVPMVAGFGARAVTATITSPLEMLRTNLQATSPTNLKNEGVWHLSKKIVSQCGVRGLWAGLPPTLLRDAPFSAVYWSTFEFTRAKMDGKIKTQFFIDFMAGAIGGMIAAALTNPIDIIKTRRQMHLGSGAGMPPKSFAILNSIYKEEGLSGFTRGLYPRVAKVAPACAIMISCYESCKKYLEK